MSARVAPNLGVSRDRGSPELPLARCDLILAMESNPDAEPKVESAPSAEAGSLNPCGFGRALRRFLPRSLWR